MKLSEVLRQSLKQKGLYSFFVNEQDIDFIKRLECFGDTAEETRKWLTIFAVSIAKIEGFQFETTCLPNSSELKTLFRSRPRLKYLNENQLGIDWLLPEDFSFYLLSLQKEGDLSKDSSFQETSASVAEDAIRAGDLFKDSSFQETFLHHILEYIKEKFNFDGLWDYFCRCKTDLEEEFSKKTPAYGENSVPSFELSMRYACLEIEKKLVFIIRDHNSDISQKKPVCAADIKKNIFFPIKRKITLPDFESQPMTIPLPVDGDNNDGQLPHHHKNLGYRDSTFKEFTVSDVRAICDEVKRLCMSDLINKKCKKSSAKNLRSFLQFAKSEAFCFTTSIFLLHKTPMENWKKMLYLLEKTIEQAFNDFDNDVYGIIADVFQAEAEVASFCNEPQPISAKKSVLKQTEKNLDSFLMSCFLNSNLRFSFFIALHSIVLQMAPYLLVKAKELLPTYLSSERNLKFIQEVKQYSPDFGRLIFLEEVSTVLLAPLAKFREELNQEAVRKILVDFVWDLLEERNERK